jgi:pimeloyl-ACP methyl ester carboxylesterase
MPEPPARTSRPRKKRSKTELISSAGIPGPVSTTRITAQLFVASPSLTEAVCDWMCSHRNLAGRLGHWLRPDLPEPLADDRFNHTYRSYSETLARVIVSAGAAGWIDEVTAPVHLVAGLDDDVIDMAFLRQLAERHPHVSLSVWSETSHELTLTHATACATEIEHLRASLFTPQPGKP